MKNIFILVSFFCCTSLLAQNSERFIPKDVDAIAMIRSGNLKKEFSTQQLDTLRFFKKLINSVLTRKTESFSSLQNYGVNTGGDIYWFYKSTDSINYNCLMLPITNTQKFITLLNYNEIWKHSTNNGRILLATQDSSVLIQLDGDNAFIVKPDVVDNYYKDDSLTAQKLGLKNAYDYYDSFFKKDTTTNYETKVDVIAEQDDSEIETSDTLAPIESDMIVESDHYDNKATDYARKDSMWYAFQDSINLHNRFVLDSIKYSNTMLFLKDAFILSQENSVIANNAFQSQKRSNDLVDFVYTPKLKKNNYSTGISNIYTSYPNPYQSFNYLNNAMSGAWFGLNMFDKIDAHLYNEKNSLKLDVLSTLDPSIKNEYSKIFEAKLNKKFYKYIDYDHLLGSASFAYNMEAYLNFFPKMITKIASSYSHSLGRDYADLASDFISLIIDEKAIAKAYKGDGLFLVDGLTPMQVNYTDYVYDSSYNYTPIQKKKTEYLPSFISMFSSDDPSLLIKALDIFVKRKKVQLHNGIYSFKVDSTFTRSYEFNIGFMIQEGIVFIGSDLEKLSQIKQGNTHFKLKKETMRFYANNNLTMNFSSINVLNALTNNPVDSSYNSVKSLLSDLGNFTFNSALTKEGITSNFNYQMNHDGENALANLLGFFNLFIHDTEARNY